MEETTKKPSPAWEHARAAGTEFVRSVESLVPPQVGEHGRAAKKELLLAVRSLIDAAIERIDRKQESQPS
jgi:hypothetical protein